MRENRDVIESHEKIYQQINDQSIIEKYIIFMNQILLNTDILYTEYFYDSPKYGLIFWIAFLDREANPPHNICARIQTYVTSYLIDLIDSCLDVMYLKRLYKSFLYLYIIFINDM